jgi:peptidyl-prolyl cis-trans isomerase C
VLLAQEAKELGFVVDDMMVVERVKEMGISEENLDEWKVTNGYSDESFKRALILAISSAWMRDKIISEVPSTAEQVHAKQILLHDSSQADAVYAQLLAGIDFDSLAVEYDPVNGGDLGWFPRGYLIVSELDETAFSLEPGSISEIIETPLGYHIIMVIERDLQYPLNANTRRAVQLQVLAEWLEAKRSLSDIEVLVR